MYTIIGADEKEYGPVAAEVLCQWIADGRANGSTRARIEGSTEWKTLADFSDFTAVLATKSGPPLMTVDAAGLPLEEIISRAESLDIGSCLGRSFALFQRNFLLLAGSTMLVMFLNVATSLILGMIPFIGGFIASAVGGIFNAGLMWLFLLRVRGEAAGVGDAFAGFSRNGLQLMLASLVIGLLTPIAFLCCLVPGIYLMVAWMFTLPVAVDKQLDFWPSMELSRKVATKHWWSLFALIVITGLISMAVPVLCGLAGLTLGGAALSPLFEPFINALKLPDGVGAVMISMAAFFIGFIGGFLISAPFTMPVSMGTVVYAYEDLFGAKPRPTN